MNIDVEHRFINDYVTNYREKYKKKNYMNVLRKLIRKSKEDIQTNNNRNKDPLPEIRINVYVKNMQEISSIDDKSKTAKIKPTHDNNKQKILL